MNESISLLLVLLFSLVFSAIAIQKFDILERKYIVLSLLAHISSAVAQMLITEQVYGGGDMNLYAQEGSVLAQLMRDHFEHYAPEVAKLLLQQSSDFPFLIIGAGHSTGSMSAIAAFLFFVFGSSLQAICILIGVFACWGKVALYETLRDSFTKQYQSLFLIACLLIPSVVFWSSALAKEAIAITGLGFACKGVYQFFRKRRFYGVCVTLLGSFFIGVTKPYILFPFVLAIGSWYALFRRQQNSKQSHPQFSPLFIFVGVIIAIGGVVLMSTLFPQFSVDHLPEQIALQQEAGMTVSSEGSYYNIGNVGIRTTTGQLVFTPIALMTSLFRPFLFEVNNPQTLVAALEMTLFLGFFLYAALKQSWKKIIRAFWSSPTLIFCFVFIVTLGTAVGLTTSNLGTLVRYRMPLMPFYACLVFILSKGTNRLSDPTVSQP